METYFEFLHDTWIYYFGSLDITAYEYDVYGRIMNKIKNKKFDFTEQDTTCMLKLIDELMFVCDYAEIKRFEHFKQQLK